jgi:hypothetical protein
MSTTKKLALGAFTLWPVLYIFLFMGFVMFSMFGMDSGAAEGPPLMFMVIFPLHMLTMLSVFALIAIYVVLAVKNKDLDDTMRIIWVLLLVMFNILAAPAYWWLCVWNTPPPRTE